MASILDSVSCTDEFEDTVCGPVWSSSGGYAAIADNDVYVQLGAKAQGVRDITYTPAVHVPVGNVLLYPDTVAARFKNYVSGSVARVSCGIFSKNEPTIALTAGGVSGGGGGLTTGQIIMWAGASPPANSLLCDGSAVSRSTYANLFGTIGTQFGVGDGVSTFNLPDLRDRVPVGAGGNTSLAGNEGTAAANRHATRHKHTAVSSSAVTDPTHSHSLGRQYELTWGSNAPGSGSAGNASGDRATSQVSGTSGAATGISVATSTTVGASTSDPADVAAYLGLGFYIVT